MAYWVGSVDEEEMRQMAFEHAKLWRAGMVIALEGELGAGKTTFARAVIKALGWDEGVRSPTFPIVVEYPTHPPVAHIDLYRVKSPEGLGLEDLLDTHLLLVEWPDRLRGLVEPDASVKIGFLGEKRSISIIDHSPD